MFAQYFLYVLTGVSFMNKTFRPFCMLAWLLLVVVPQLWASPPKRDYVVFEYGISLGAAHYFGDLNDNFGLHAPSYMGGVWGRYNLNDYVAVRLNLAYAHVGYDDKYNIGAPFETLRNLRFESDVYELNVQGDFNFYAFLPKDERYFFTPYLSVGLGVVGFDPYTTYQGKTYFLRTLGTEGQDVSRSKSAYSNIAVCIPLGVGVKFNIGKYVNIGLELGYRFLTTDYLDDVSGTYAGAQHFTNNSPSFFLQDRSLEIPNQVALGRAGKQRGNPYQNDGYAFAGVFVSFNIIRTPECPDDRSFQYKYKRSKSYKTPTQ